MRKIMFFPFFIFPFLGLACTTPGQPSRQGITSLSLQAVDEVKVGSARLDDLKGFGMSSQSFEDPSKNIRVLVDCEKIPCTHEAVICRLDKATGVLQSIAWVPKSSDSDANLDSVFGHYKDLRFSKQRLQYDYGHYFEISDKYSNSEAGIVISYDPDKKLVTQVYRGARDSFISPKVSSGKFPIVTVLPE